jgi:hypothetical protein
MQIATEISLKYKCSVLPFDPNFLGKDAQKNGEG